MVNVSPSSTGSYPNAGPLILVQAGVPLVDVPGPALFDDLRDGEPLVIDGGEHPRRRRDVRRRGPPARGRRAGAASSTSSAADRPRRCTTSPRTRWPTSARRASCSRGAIDFPETRTDFRDRHVLIVVRGTDHLKDLRALRAYIHDVRPVLVGVDGGADAILEEGLQPDVILGDMDSASDERAAQRRRADRPRLSRRPRARAASASRSSASTHTVVPAAGTSQDVAMLLAYEKGAALIVSVGAHFNLIEFLDKHRDGMSSTFLTRLRIGETLVDAKGVSRLYNPGVAGVSQMTRALSCGVVLASC